MTDTTIWYSGKNNYKKLTFTEGYDNNCHSFNTELIDVDSINSTDIHKIFSMHLDERRNRTVEILYSGGYDSELVLFSCLVNKIPCRAITMRVLINGILTNTHDIYYAEKFCRMNKVEQKFIDLDAGTFFNSDQYINYLKPYKIVKPHVAAHFWMIEQCTEYPVMCGGYNWPWADLPIISPFRHYYSMYDVFMKDHNIDGIGNMLSHSNDANLLQIKMHRSLYNTKQAHAAKIYDLPIFRKQLLEELGYSNAELRLRSFTFDNVPGTSPITREEKLRGMFGDTTSSITWNKMMADIIGSDCPGYNDRF